MGSLAKRFSALALVAVVLAWHTTPVHATDKTLIQLQAQVQDLQDALARMQQANDERWALTKNSLDQNADAMARMSATLALIQHQIASQQDNGRTEQLSSQVQAVHDSVDEVKARLARLEKQLNDISAAQQNLQAPAPSGSGGQADNSPSGNQGGGQPDAAAAAYVPPVRDLYQSAYRDYTGGHYNLAQQEFAQIVQSYPQDELAANSQYYLGEILFHQGQFRDAAKVYDGVLQNYPGSAKAAAAQLRKGDALIQVGQRAEGIRELRGVIQRYPQSPESAQARTTLNGMGVTLAPRPARSE